VQNPLADQLPDLLSAFEKTCSEVDVEQMKRRTPDIDIRPQTAPSLASAYRYVMVMDPAQWEAAKQQVTVGSAIKAAVLTEPAMVSKFRGNESRLILLVLSRDAHYFLEGNHIGSNLTQHSNNAGWPDSAIHAAALVDVVRCDPNCGRHCSRLRWFDAYRGSPASVRYYQ